jgi:hypothetical protein
MAKRLTDEQLQKLRKMSITATHAKKIVKLYKASKNRDEFYKKALQQLYFFNKQIVNLLYPPKSQGGKKTNKTKRRVMNNRKTRKM